MSLTIGDRRRHGGISRSTGFGLVHLDRRWIAALPRSSTAKAALGRLVGRRRRQAGRAQAWKEHPDQGASGAADDPSRRRWLDWSPPPARRNAQLLIRRFMAPAALGSRSATSSLACTDYEALQRAESVGGDIGQCMTAVLAWALPRLSTGCGPLRSSWRSRTLPFEVGGEVGDQRTQSFWRCVRDQRADVLRRTGGVTVHKRLA